MDFFNNQCRACGGATVREGNEFVCKFCGSRWALVAEDSLQVKLQNAWEAQRHSDFDRATELFEEIISGNKKCFEAYWGRALARNGIVFVNDLNEHKKVPTCNNITENRFTTDKDVLAAISSAPSEISADYKKRAEQIEKIRLEWLEKASKEPPYDVFICFKDSDRENGITRTPDSVNAQELYTYLVSQGYNVFFSRVSLRDKISEQYEPYIYNALKTAKVMIVYGEKAEYFNAVWLKNEWTRFRTRIERGEKHKNSLVVAYRNIDVADLPAGLRSRQLIDASEMTFLTSLENHIKKVIEASNQAVKIEKIKIEGGGISKKAAQLSVNSVKTREIGVGGIAETDISEKQILSLISTYLNAAAWNDAEKLIEEVLFDDPGCAEAMWHKVLLNNKACNDLALANVLSSKESSFGDFSMIDKILNCASKDFASRVLDFFYSVHMENDELYRSILKVILPYSYEHRHTNLEKAIKNTISMSFSKSFDLLLSTLGSDEVDRYIQLNYDFANTSNEYAHKIKYSDNILSVDEGNVHALRLKFYAKLKNNAPSNEITSDFEALLKYANNIDAEVIAAIKAVCKEAFILTDNNVPFIKQLLKYHSGNIADIKDHLILIAQKHLKLGCFSEAQYYCNLILSVDKNCAEAYLGICLAKIGARNEDDILNRSSCIKTLPEFNKYLSLVDDKRRIKCIELSNSQEEKILRCLEKAKALVVESENAIIQEKKHTHNEVIILIVGFILSIVSIKVLFSLTLEGIAAIFNDGLSDETPKELLLAFILYYILGIVCLFFVFRLNLGAIFVCWLITLGVLVAPFMLFVVSISRGITLPITHKKDMKLLKLSFETEQQKLKKMEVGELELSE